MNYQWLWIGLVILICLLLFFAALYKLVQRGYRGKPAGGTVQEASERTEPRSRPRPKPAKQMQSEPSLSRSLPDLQGPSLDPALLRSRPLRKPALPTQSEPSLGRSLPLQQGSPHDPALVRSHPLRKPALPTQPEPSLSRTPLPLPQSFSAADPQRPQPAAPAPIQPVAHDALPAIEPVAAQPASPAGAPSTAVDSGQDMERAAIDQDASGFPDLKVSDLPEEFCYTARLVCPAPGFEAMQLHEMSADIIQQLRLQKHQFLLGWSANGQWQSLRSDGRYLYAVWAVPLCDGASALTGNDLSAIVRCVQTWMRRVGGRALLPPLPEVAERISQAEEFVRQCDQIIRTNLVAFKEDNAQPQSCGAILDIAFSYGMEEVDGRIEKRVNSETVYIMRGGKGDDLGSKSPDRKLTKLYLELVVPRVTRPRKCCEDMFDFAGKLGRVLGFRLVDDAGGTVPEEQIVGCLERIDDIVATLHEHGIKPGSKVARALFS